MCGGTYQLVWASPPCQGLSPRVRGNRPRQFGGGHQTGSIPACAGEPVGGQVPTGRIEVYPRVCGGTQPPSERPPPIRGLSPRVRGNPSDSARQRVYPRSIPACAGEPPPWSSRAIAIWVYPRVCGGTRRPCILCRPRPGLSPRVRGNRKLAGKDAFRPGSIPACAGEPVLGNEGIQAGRVYPRVCGGTPRRPTSAKPGWGLSPRVRGNQVGLL